MKKRPIQERLPEYTRRLVETYRDDVPMAHNLDQHRRLPSRELTVGLVKKIFELLYPGYFGSQHLTRENVAYHVGALLDDAADETRRAGVPGHPQRVPQGRTLHPLHRFHRPHRRGVLRRRSPRCARLLTLDLQAAYDGDPAAKNFAEILLAYPGLEAISVYRLAHVLHRLEVPLLPAHHDRVGAPADRRRHPSGRADRRELLHRPRHRGRDRRDDRHRLQREDLPGRHPGALSFPKDERGRLIRGQKRHPTIEDDVVIYAGATILGGDTVIGTGSVIGGNTWVTHSIPPHSKVLSTPQEQRIEPGEGPTDRARC